MTVRATILTAAAIGLAAALASCGGGEDATSQSAEAEPIKTSSLTKAAYLKKANIACFKKDNQVEQEIGSFIRKIAKIEGELPEPILLARILKEVLLPSYEGEIEEISELGAPAGDQKKIEAMLAAQAKAVEKSEQVNRVTYPEEFEKYFEKVSRELEGYGFTSCIHG